MLTLDKTPLLTKMPLFEAGQNGYHVCRIPGLLVTKRRVAIASTEARRGSGGDYDDIDLVLRRSVDGGLTWSAPQILASNTPYGPGPMHNLSLICDRADGVVHAVYCYDYARVFHVKSSDDGLTFSAPVEITAAAAEFRKIYPWRTVGTGPAHGLQLQNGRFIIPTWYSDGSGTEMGTGKRGHRPSVVSVMFSDDHGTTWQCGDTVAANGKQFSNPSETAAVELPDGRVLFNMRTECAQHRRLIAISPNGATQWSAPHFDFALLDPVCLASMVRLSGLGDGKKGRVLFANPDTVDRDVAKAWSSVNCDRKNLTLQLSYDDCRTWTLKKVLEAGASGYSDLQLLPDGTMLCLYECGAPGDAMFQDHYLMLARFNLEWLTDGRESL